MPLTFNNNNTVRNEFLKSPITYDFKSFDKYHTGYFRYE